MMIRVLLDIVNLINSDGEAQELLFVWPIAYTNWTRSMRCAGVG